MPWGKPDAVRECAQGLVYLADFSTGLVTNGSEQRKSIVDGKNAYDTTAIDSPSIAHIDSSSIMKRTLTAHCVGENSTREVYKSAHCFALPSSSSGDIVKNGSAHVYSGATSKSTAAMRTDHETVGGCGGGDSQIDAHQCSNNAYSVGKMYALGNLEISSPGPNAQIISEPNDNGIDTGAPNSAHGQAHLDMENDL